MLAHIEYVVNQTPNRTIGYSAFYLNYRYHPLSPIHMIGGAHDTANEAVQQFVGRMQANFDTALQQLHRATEQMRQAADQHRKMGEFNVGDLVLLNTRHIKFRQTPHKLQRRYIGPFQILQKISKVAYKLELPENWKMHPVFHISLLKLWKQSQWSSPANAPVPDIDEDDQQYRVERILR